MPRGRQDDNSDVGLGATLAYLRKRTAEDSRLYQGIDDNGGRPRKKQNTQQNSDSSRTDDRISASEHQGLQNEQKDRSSAERAHPPSKSPQVLNPFSTKKNETADDREGDAMDTTASAVVSSGDVSSGEKDAMDTTATVVVSGREEDAMDTTVSLVPSTKRDGKQRKDSDSRPTQSKDKDSTKKQAKKRDHKNSDDPWIKHAPHIRLNNQVTVNNLQGLVLYLLADGSAPQWVAVQKRASIQQVVVLLVPGLELGMFTGEIDLVAAAAEVADTEMLETSEDTETKAKQQDYQANLKRLRLDLDSFHPAKLDKDRLPVALKPLSDVFPRVYPVNGTADSSGGQFHRLHSPIQSMLTSSIPKTRDERKMKRDKNHKGPIPQSTRNYRSKRAPITTFLTSLSEQEENQFAIHPAWFTTPEAKEVALQHRVTAKKSGEFGWKDSNVESLEHAEVPDIEIEKGSTTVGRQVLTVDCEMCKAAGKVDVLTRVSLIDWDGKTIYDELVKPDVPIIDYVTQFSGITEAMLEPVTTTLADVQMKLLELVTPRTILMGHSLNSDLNALKFTHPFLIETGILYPHPRGPPFKLALKWLSQKYLKREIQTGTEGHDSVQDAVACLDLVKQKCEHGPEWGTGDMNSESIFKRLGRVTRPSKSAGGPGNRAGAIVDWGFPRRGFGSQAAVAIGCESDADVVKNMSFTVQGLPAGGSTDKAQHVDFAWGRLRELELVRGWWVQSKTADVDVLRTNAAKRLGWGGAEVTGSALGDAVTRTVKDIVDIYDALHPCTAFIVYSGTGDPREMGRLQAMRQTHFVEYRTKNWDDLSVKWTDTEVQALSRACSKAREGLAFVTVK